MDAPTKNASKTATAATPAAAAPTAQSSALNAEKAKALQAALAQIEKQFGKGSIMRLGDGEQAEDIQVVSTGSLGLDIALGVGGGLRGVLGGGVHAESPCSVCAGGIMTSNWISVQLSRKDYSRAEARCVSLRQQPAKNQSCAV